MKRICLRKAPGRSSGSGWLPFSHIDFIKLQWTHQRGMVTLHDQMRESQRFVPPGRTTRPCLSQRSKWLCSMNTANWPAFFNRQPVFIKVGVGGVGGVGVSVCRCKILHPGHRSPWPGRRLGSSNEDAVPTLRPRISIQNSFARFCLRAIFSVSAVGANIPSRRPLLWAVSPPTAFPSDNASSGSKPRRSATIAAHSVNTGARLIKIRSCYMGGGVICSTSSP